MMPVLAGSSLGSEAATDDRPVWAQEIVAARRVRGWSQGDAVRELRKVSAEVLPDEATMVRQWKRWESGRTMPGDFYRPLIADLFGASVLGLFPEVTGVPAEPVNRLRLRTKVDLFGGPEPQDWQTRVEIRVSLHPTADELMGMVVFGGFPLAPDELDDDEAVSETVRFALVHDGAGRLGTWAEQIRRAFAEPDTCPDLPAGYLPRLRRAVARVFGVVA
jgi:transcriptional regulator with XRE-family HTH domain